MQKVKSFISFSMIWIFIPLVSWAQNLCDVLYLEPNRPIYTETSLLPQSNPNSTTFLLLPGVNRGWLQSDKVTKALTQAGYQYVTMNFSPHAFSVAQLSPNQIGTFERRNIALIDLAQEIEFVKSELSKKYNLTQLITVTLSYSGLISPLLKDSIIIDTAPLTSSAAAYPEFEAYRIWLTSLELINPFFGPIWTRSQLDLQYRQYWTKKVEEFISDYQLPVTKKSRMIEGQVSLSRAAEAQSWNLNTLSNKTNRTLILAGKEKTELLKHQLHLIKREWTRENWIRVFVVPDSGHVIPAERPTLYVKILENLVTQNMGNIPLLTIAHSTDKQKWEHHNLTSALRWIESKTSELE